MATVGGEPDGALVWFEHVTLGTVAVSPAPPRLATRSNGHAGPPR